MFLQTKDFFFSGEEFKLFWNKQKDVLITESPKKNIESYYKSESYLSHSESPKGFVGKAYNTVKRYMLWRKKQMLKKYEIREKTLLDIGSGTGSFLEYMKKDNWNVVGIENNSKAKKISADKGLEIENEIPNKKTFSVITLWHVLEHFEFPEQEVEKIHNILSGKGLLFIAVPNFNSYDAKHYKNYWAGYDVPRHLYHFSKRGLTRILQEKGFNVIKTKPMIFDSFYISLMSEKNKNGKASFFKAFKIGLLSNITAWFTKEYSSNIFIVTKK